jgi:hypothetical protein
MTPFQASRRAAVATLATWASLFAGTAFAQAAPRIAVTDLGYTERVAEYFEAATASQQSALKATTTSLSASGSASMTYVAGTHSYLEHRELRAFSNDIRGALIKGTSFRLVQGKGFDAGDPQPSAAERALQQVQTGKVAKPQRRPDVNDIIARIRKGEFAGADYVLFGQLSSIEFRDTVAPLQGTTSASHQFGLDLLADFSLIDTRSFEIKAAFSAQGAGNDTKLLSARGDVMPPNRAKVMRETSQSLAAEVFSQLGDQLSLDRTLAPRLRGAAPAGGQHAPAGAAPAQPEVIILR